MKFSLRSLFIIITVIALFLGWLRPHKAMMRLHPDSPFGLITRGIWFEPLFYPAEIAIYERISVYDNDLLFWIIAVYPDEAKLDNVPYAVIWGNKIRFQKGRP